MHDNHVLTTSMFSTVYRELRMKGGMASKAQSAGQERDGGGVCIGASSAGSPHATRLRVLTPRACGVGHRIRHAGTSTLLHDGGSVSVLRLPLVLRCAVKTLPRSRLYCSTRPGRNCSAFMFDASTWRHLLALSSAFSVSVLPVRTASGEVRAYHHRQACHCQA